MNDSGKAVFLSYASQDAEAAKRICDALRAAGVEVWFDVEGGLETGDEWDAKIRRQIKECVLFLPIISANTQAREEGYFRIEWELAAQRALGIASGVAFILPIVIDDTREPAALVPDRFRTVQWTRLRGGEMTPEAKAKFVKLWSHRAGVLKHQADVGAASRDGGNADGRARGAPLPGSSPAPGWKVYAGLGVAVFALAGGATWWLLRPAPAEPVSSPSPPVAPAPVSEARQLVARARALSLDKYNSTAADFAAAEGLIKRALELDANDGEVWAVSSLFNTLIRTRGFDLSPARREAARSEAERALTLAPESIEARYALGRWQRDNESDPTIAERTFLEVLARNPEHPGALQSLGTFYQRGDRSAEALAMFERAAKLPGQLALARFGEFLTHFGNGRFDDAERCVRESITAEASSNSVCGLAMLLLTRGDAAGVTQAFAALPVGSRNEHRAVWVQAFAQLAARQPDDALKTLDRLSADFIQDNWFTGPKAYWVGRAHLQAGRPEAARIALEAGLAVAEARLNELRGTALRVTYGEMLALLGRTEGALREARAVAELQRSAPVGWIVNPARIHALLGRVDEVVPRLQPLLPPQPVQRFGWPLTPALLRIDPLWDKLRGDLRFRQLCVEPAAPVVARDWPKHPDLKKAIDLIEGLESIPDDFALAEQLVKPILERSPADLEAVTVMARLQSQYMRRGFDRSDERSAQARLYGERALQLDPNEPEAMLAVATYLFTRDTGDARAERLLRRGLEVDSANPRHGRMLADLLNVQPGRQAEALAQAEENVRRFPRDTLTHYDLARLYKDQGRFEEFDRELDATLALTPLPNAIAWKARLQFGLHNDFPGMKRWLDQVPERVRGTERAVFGYFLYAAFGGDVDTGLEALRAFTQKWFTDFEYAGPTALLNADLLLRQGKIELARQQYEAAWLEIQRMRATDPTRIWLNHAEFWTLLGLGRKTEAKVAFGRLVEAQRRPYAQSLFTGWWFTLIPGALLIGERDTALEYLRECVATVPEVRGAIRVRLQLDPRMAPWRDDPEIRAILAELGAGK